MKYKNLENVLISLIVRHLKANDRGISKYYDDDKKFKAYGFSRVLIGLVDNHSSIGLRQMVKNFGIDLISNLGININSDGVLLLKISINYRKYSHDDVINRIYEIKDLLYHEVGHLECLVKLNNKGLKKYKDDRKFWMGIFKRGGQKFDSMFYYLSLTEIDAESYKFKHTRSIGNYFKYINVIWKLNSLEAFKELLIDEWILKDIEKYLAEEYGMDIGSFYRLVRNRIRMIYSATTLVK